MTLAAVCAYFNPCGYESRRRNYDAFRRSIENSGVGLLTIELIFDSESPSRLGAHGNVVTIRGGDVMWQKERLLQIGIDILLAHGHTAIAWLDADIVFENKMWHEEVLRALERFDYVQTFDQLVSHYPEGQLVRAGAAKDHRSWAHGGGWAGTGDFWQRFKLYQHCILGGGDTVMANVVFQLSESTKHIFRWPDENIVLRQFNKAMQEHVTTGAHDSCAGWRVGYVAEQTAHLLPHGHRRRRYHVERWQALKNYDPRTDIQIADSGAFRWSTDKPLLHRSVRGYFAARREDE